MAAGRGACRAVCVLLICTCATALTTSGPSCAVPKSPQFLAMPRCRPSNKTLEDAAAVAWRFAPIVYHHPLEQYHLQSPDVWYNASELYLQDLLPANESTFAWFGQSTLDELMFMPRSFRTVLNSTTLTEQQRDAIIAGAPFDAKGRSTAKVAVNVDLVYADQGARTDPLPGMWLFNYQLYYSWNGCSNQDLAVSLDGERQVIQYLACPLGVHEGDWEHISVLVCAEDLSIQQTAYSQHGWWETRDCTQPGQCPTEQNENDPSVFNPVTYIGFESHANYYESSPLVVYAWKNASVKGVQLDNFGGVWVGDRTLKSSDGKKFVPTPDNILLVPNASVIEGRPEWEWALYPGNWGAPLQKGKISFQCLNENQTALQPCPENQATRALTTAFKLLDVAGLASGGGASESYYPGFNDVEFKVKAATNSSWVSPAEITGPLYRTWSYQWLPERYAPIFSDFKNASTNGSDVNTVIMCPNDSYITQGYPDFVFDLSASHSVNAIVNYLVGICVGAILVSFIFVLLMLVPSLLSKAVASPVRLYAAGKSFMGAAADEVGKGGAWARSALQKVPGLSGDSKRQSALALPAPEPAPAPEAAAAAAAAVGAAAAGTAGAGREDSAAVVVTVGPDSSSAGQEEEEQQQQHQEEASAALPADLSSQAAAEDHEWNGLKHHLGHGHLMGHPPSKVELSVKPSAHPARRGLLMWTFAAAALYIAAVVLLALGTHQFVSESVSSFATTAIGKTAPVQAVKWLIIGALILTGVLDLLTLFIVFVARAREIKLGKYRFRNRLHNDWVANHTYKLHIVMSGQVVLVISIATILFGLGLVVTTVQLTARLACSALADLNVDDFTLADVCISVNSLSDQPICGWQALELCYEVTGMQVLMISLGAMLLLWSHVMWLVVLLLSMWELQEWKVVVPRKHLAADDRQGSSCNGDAVSNQAGSDDKSAGGLPGVE